MIASIVDGFCIELFLVLGLMTLYALIEYRANHRHR